MGFKQFFEVEKEILPKIGKEINAFSRGDIADRPFNNIFGNKSRIVIPLKSDPTQHELVTDLEKLGYNVDYKNGMASKTIQTQRGPKETKQRIGAVLQKLSKSDKKMAEYLHWWEKVKPNLKNEAQGLSVVISRHPIDILRMSDHDEISSCHSPTGSYFKCAIQEAKTGGAVAYIVRNSELNKIKNLQAKEIFADPDRRIGGVEPLERIRLRRFQIGDKDILVPEKRTYGIAHVGFDKALMNWARSVQKDIIDFDNPPNFKNVDLRGGSYQDNSASEIWNRFLGKEVSWENKKSKDQKTQDSKINNADSWQEQADAQLQGHQYKHYYVSVSAEEDDGRPYLMYDASVCFEFPVKIFNKVPTEKDTWKLQKEISHKLDIYTVDYVNIDIWKNSDVRICLQLRDEPEAHHTQLESFEHFLDYIDECDKNYEEQKNALTSLLEDYDFLSRENHAKKLPKFNHFKIQETEERRDVIIYHLESDGLYVGDLQGLPHLHFYRKGWKGPDFEMPQEITSRASTIFPNFIKPENISFVFDAHGRETAEGAEGLDKEGDKVITIPVSIFLKLNFNLYSHPRIIAGLKYIDKNWNFYEKRAQQFWKVVERHWKANKGKSTASTYGANFNPVLLNKKPVFTPTPKQKDLPFPEGFQRFFTEETKEQFWTLAQLQRDAPERAMLKFQRLMSGGIMAVTAEHLGDLIHRMSEKSTFQSAGYEFVKEKVVKLLRWLNNPYGFDREFQENIRNNAREMGIDEEEYRTKIYESLKKYASEHARLPAFNHAQKLAQLATIELGNLNYSKVIAYLNILEANLSSVEKWVNFAHQGLTN